MDPLTLFIAKLVGPAILAFGIGIFVSRDYYAKIYRDLQRETLAVFMTGLTVLLAGIAIVLYHNIWDSFLAGLVSLMGWLSVVKGLALLIVPGKVDKIGDAIAESNFFTFAGALAVIAGGYLSYVSYF